MHFRRWEEPDGGGRGDGGNGRAVPQTDTAAVDLHLARLFIFLGFLSFWFFIFACGQYKHPYGKKQLSFLHTLSCRRAGQPYGKISFARLEKSAVFVVPIVHAVKFTN